MQFDEGHARNAPLSDEVWLEFAELDRVTIHTSDGRRTTSSAEWKRANLSAPPGSSPLEQVLRAGDGPSDEASEPVGPRVPYEVGHYRVIGRLGGGGFGEVYEALDLERGELVALKTLSAPSPAADLRFKGEVRIVADLEHPNLLTPYELLESSGRLAFAMRRVHGGDFVSAVRGGLESGWSDALEPRLFSALAQLHSALVALHGRGILHLDIKPSNVLIDPSGHLFVLDFGLSRGRVSHTRTRGVVGTLTYLAPEQLLDGTASEASDWFAVGVMLFEALTGTRPFPDPATTGVFASTFMDAPSASSIAPSVPPALDALCAALLQRDPSRRATAHDIAQVLDRAADPPAEDEPFVGRGSELARLHGCWRDHVGARVVLVSGPAGIGKSTLLEAFTREVRAQASAPLALAGRCFERESVAYKGLDAIIEGLYEWLVQKDSMELERYVEAGDRAVARLFPVLGSLLPISDEDGGDRRLPLVEQRDLAVAALGRILERVARRDGLLVILDDVQWSSAETARLLAQLLLPPHAVRALLVCACRSDGPQGARPEFVRELEARVRIAEDVVLGPLDPAYTKELCSLVGVEAMSMSERDRIAQLSEGNPFLVGWLARHRGVGPDTTAPLDNALATLTGDAGGARAYLEVIAIAGGPISQECAASAAGLVTDDRPLVASLRARHLVRTDGPRRRDQVATYHDRIRSMVLGPLTPERRRQLHHSVAKALEAHPGERGPHLAELAWHYHEGGVDSKAVHFARLAGEAANEAMAFASAARHFGSALDWGTTDEGERRALLTARATALADAGLGEEAARAFDQAAALHPDPERTVLLRRGIEQRLLTGRLDEGVAGLRALARVERLPYPRTTAGALLSFALGLVRLWSRTRRLRTGGRPTGGSAARGPSETSRLELATVAQRGMMTSDLPRSAFYGLFAANLALRVGDRHQVALNFVRVGAMLLTPFGPRFQRWGGELLRFAEDEARALGEPALLGSVAIGRAMVAFWHGRWAQALELSDSAMSTRKGRPANGAYDCNLARLMAIRSLEELGRWGDAGDRNREMFRDALDRSDLYAEVTALLNFGMVAVTNGDPAGARDAATRCMTRWGRAVWDVQHVYALRIELYAELLEGTPERVFQRIEASWKSLKRGLHLSVATSRVDFFLLRARAALACLVRSASARLEADAQHSVRTLAAIEREDAAAHAVAMEACLAAIRGTDEARDLFARAAELYEGLGMSAAAASARLRVAQLAHGEASAEVERESARLGALGIAQPLTFTEHYLPARGVKAR